MRIRTRIASLLVVIACGLLLVTSASAHAEYERSVPAAEAVVNNPPGRVDIWFTQELFRRQGENQILVYDPDNHPIQVGETQLDNDDRNHLWVNLSAGLKPGKYRVDWSNLSAEDGDKHMGSFTFTLDPHASMTSTVPNLQQPSETSPSGTGSSNTLTTTTSITPSQTAVSSPAAESPPAKAGGILIISGVILGCLIGTALFIRGKRSVRS